MVYVIFVLASKIQTRLARTVFEVMTAIFHYNLVSISLNDRALDTYLKQKIKCFYCILIIWEFYKYLRFKIQA